MSTYERTEQLANLVNTKHGILQQLRELARRQVQTVESSDMTRLLTILSAKQLLLKDLQAAERSLDPFRADDPETRLWRSASAREQCRQVAGRCETLLREIMLIEQNCESELINRRDQAASRLDEAHGASQARRAYAQSQLHAPNQIDLSTN